MRIKQQVTRDSSMFSHFLDLISAMLVALPLLTKTKLILLNKNRLKAVMRVDAMDGRLDEAKDICDHFASNHNNPGWTSTGVSEMFFK